MDVEQIKILIKRLAKNDEKALDELFELTKQKFYFVARDYLEERSYIDDVLSEAYYKIYKKSKLYNEKYNGYNWMYEIVKNTSIDFNRRNKKNRDIEEYNDLIYKPEEEILGNIKKEEIIKALKTLDEKEYKIIYLRIWENKTLKIIAEMMNSSITSVYYTYKEALRKIRSELE